MSVSAVSSVLKSRLSSSAERQKVFEDLLKTADSNKDGTVTYEDFCAVLKRNEVPLQTKEMRKMFQAIDTDADG